MTTPKRPTIQHPDVIAHVAAELVPAVVDWLSADPDTREQEDQLNADVLDELKQILTSSLDWDGYSLAREMERKFCYSSDSSLVDVLDRADLISHQKTREVEEAWVMDNQIQPEYRVGQVVQVQMWWGNDFISSRGPISAIDEKWAHYTVDLTEPKGNFIFAFERVKPVVNEEKTAGQKETGFSS